MDTFNDDSLTPDQLKMLTLQFMGQNMGELKELDKNLISKTNSLQGMYLDPHAVLNSIGPVSPPAPQPNPYIPQPPAAVHAAPQLPIQPQVAQAAAPTVIKDENQLELDFSNTITAEKIFNKLLTLERKIDAISERVNSTEKKTA